VLPTDVGRGKKPMSGRHGNARRLDIGPIWFFDMQPTSVQHRAVLHIRCRTDMKARLLLERCTNAVASPFGVNEALCKHNKTMP